MQGLCRLHKRTLALAQVSTHNVFGCQLTYHLAIQADNEANVPGADLTDLLVI